MYKALSFQEWTANHTKTPENALPKSVDVVKEFSSCLRSIEYEDSTGTVLGVLGLSRRLSGLPGQPACGIT